MILFKSINGFLKLLKGSIKNKKKYINYVKLKRIVYLQRKKINCKSSKSE